MRDILQEIIDHKSKEVIERKSLYPVPLLEQSLFFNNPCVSLKSYLLRQDKHGIIAEIKRKSPSKGEIHPYLNVEELSIGYMQSGASALSILTDDKFFGGNKNDLITARKFNYCPILRKDFIIDEYQLFETRSWGADVVLLIAAALSVETTKKLAKKARELGLEVLLEVHNKAEAEEHLNEHISLVGVNNRDLKTFETNLEISMELADFLPKDMIKISESGIRNAEDIILLKQHGYNGFLVGESFMKTSQPQAACAKLINELDKLTNDQYAKA